MDKIDEIRRALTETYKKSFNLKEPTATLFSGIEVLMLMIDEDPDVILSQYHDREIQMYNYLINEMIMELRNRRIETFNAERIVRNVVDIRQPRPITVHLDRNDWNRSIVLPQFEIEADLDLPNLTFLSIKPPAMDHRNLTSSTSDFDLRANDHGQTSSISVVPVELRFESVIDEMSSDIALQKYSTTPPTTENINKEMFPFPSEVRLFRNSEEIEDHPVHLPSLADLVSVDERELIRDFDLQISDVIRSSTMQKIPEMQQFGNLVDVEEALVTLSDFSPPLRRIDLPSTKELPSKQPDQFEELEVDLPEIPPDDIFIQEFKAFFESRRREKAATDYAERTTLRAKRSSTNLEYRDISRNISPLIPIFDEAHWRRVMLPVFSQTKISISNQIQDLLIKAYNQRHQGSLVNDSLNTEFSNLIVNKPQSTPETPQYGKQKSKKWTSALPVLEEDQMDVQRAPEISVDPNKIITQSKPTDSHQTPLTAKHIQRASWKLADSRSPLPVPLDEIELPPPAEIEPPPAAEIALPPEVLVQKQNLKQSRTSSSNVLFPENDRLIFRHPAKRPRMTEKEYTTTEVQKMTEDAVFEQYLNSWKRSFLLNVNETHRDTHFPVELLNTLDFGTVVHQVLNKLVNSGNNQLNYFLPPTSTRKEAAKRIDILLELRTQNVLEFIVQDGEVTGIYIKH